MHLTGPSLVAVATGIVGSAWASGAIASATLMGVSAAMDVPETTARSWRELYRRGASLMPKVAGAAALAYVWAAASTAVAHRQASPLCWGGYVAAAGFVVAIVPFTLVVMRPTNDRLHRAAEGRDDEVGAGGESGSGLRDLLRRWNALNLTRSCLCLVSSVLGMVTLVQNMQTV